MIAKMDEMNRKLGVIIALLASPVNPADKMTLRDQITKLEQSGLKPVEIATILNKTQSYVNKELTVVRRSKK